MGYMSINNLYRNPGILNEILEWWALEKIHGTSARISFSDKEVKFFSGGEKYEKFVGLFGVELLKTKFLELQAQKNFEKIVIYGEAYGGKQQKMSHTYGNDLKFICFEVQIDDKWLNVPDAEQIVLNFGLEFVSYKKISAENREQLEKLLKEARDEQSIQAIRNSIGEGKTREGIVMRPIVEKNDLLGERIIYKYKTTEFSENKNPRDLVKISFSENTKLAEDWVTLRRLEHILDKFSQKKQPEISDIIKEMEKDIFKEAGDEITDSIAVRKAIRKESAKLYITFLKNKLESKKTAQTEQTEQAVQTLKPTI